MLELKAYELEESSEVKLLRLGGFYLKLGTFNSSQKDEHVDSYFANVWFSVSAETESVNSVELVIRNSWYIGTSSVTLAFKSKYGVDALRIFDVCSVQPS